ncbi:MAG TPA: imidazole glycerol phosphate synthase subunit HisH [Smithellaceae bacterium]|nr:imidazole glycerol phosphate synthase subunit HisH [Smithellaceae bacterium]
MRHVAIVDYEAGNLFSVEHACRSVGLKPSITNRPEDIIKADRLILPGVGAFGTAMDNLIRLDLVEPIKEYASRGRPFMGICLGMQLLFSSSQEFGEYPGLNLIEGVVVKFPEANPSGERIKVPQIGWNRIFRLSETENRWSGTPLELIMEGDFMYFVHSLYACPQDPRDILAMTDYEGIRYCSAVKRGNIFATQFHPEKSAKEGIKIYQYWAAEIGAGGS